MADILRGKPVADAMDERTIEIVKDLRQRGTEPQLAIVRVGERKDDLAYERGALRRCEKTGIAVKKVVLPPDISQQDLLEAVRALNEDSAVHGILLFRPLPAGIDESIVCETICPRKDVDGVTSASMASVYSGKGEGFAPCTAQAVMEMLRYYNLDAAGRRAVVAGRSLVIGKPVSMLLMAANATVTVCHSRTSDMARITKDADIVVAAMGKAEYLGAEYFSEGQTVIDVGINYSAERQKLVGDVAFDEVENMVSAITPVPAGVGSVTTAVLMRHTAEAAGAQKAK